MNIQLLLAAAAGCDHRTAERALRHGPAVIRTRTVREAIVAAARSLDIKLPAADAGPPQGEP